MAWANDRLIPGRKSWHHPWEHGRRRYVSSIVRVGPSELSLYIWKVTRSDRDAMGESLWLIAEGIAWSVDDAMGSCDDVESLVRAGEGPVCDDCMDDGSPIPVPRTPRYRIAAHAPDPWTLWAVAMLANGIDVEKARVSKTAWHDMVKSLPVRPLDDEAGRKWDRRFLMRLAHFPSRFHGELCRAAFATPIDPAKPPAAPRLAGTSVESGDDDEA